ncbi:MAG: hypothetical protein AAGA76_05665 [Pseudomonadota bacterium]
MEAINQLKTLRDEALQRLQNNPDYKLLTSLDDLIVDLENVTNTGRPKFKIIDDETDEVATQAELNETVEEAFEQISAEIESEEAALDPESEDQPKSFVSFS